jgi:hypothetical protein
MLNKLTQSKFNTDLLWNMASFGLVAIIGIVLNIIIFKVYHTDVLGVFNQVFAIYLLLSQLAVGGVHLGVQRFVPAYIKSEMQTKQEYCHCCVNCVNRNILVGYFNWLHAQRFTCSYFKK